MKIVEIANSEVPDEVAHTEQARTGMHRYAVLSNMLNMLT